MFYAYIRISTKKQSKARQIYNITNYCIDHKIDIDSVGYYEDVGSGRTMDRDEWNSLMGVIKSGDTIIFDEASRMCRDRETGFKTYRELESKGINLIFLKESYINTYNHPSDIRIRIAFAVAQDEIDLLSKRTIEGIQASRKKSGHPFGSTYETEKAKKSKAKIMQLSACCNGNLNDRETMEIIGISKPTFYKYKKEMLARKD